jgi:hypothetical protein
MEENPQNKKIEIITPEDGLDPEVDLRKIGEVIDSLGPDLIAFNTKSFALFVHKLRFLFKKQRELLEELRAENHALTNAFTKYVDNKFK